MMRRKALAFLLLAPFAIAILSFVTSSYVIREVEQDIQRIDWEYKDNEAVSLEGRSMKLTADAVYDERYPLSEGNKLVWSLEAMPPFEDVATLETVGEDTYAIFHRPGRVGVICSNEKKNVQRRFTLTIYDQGGAVLIDTDRPWSQANIDSVHYVGLYDLTYSDIVLDAYGKRRAELGFTVSLYGAENVTLDDLVMTHSENISVSRPDGTIRFLEAGPAYLTFSNPWYDSPLAEYTLNFEIIDGVNVYSYDDLLMATNFSSKGETVVQRVHLDSLQNTVQGYFNDETARYVPLLDEKGNLQYKDPSGATELMGHYDIKNDSFSYQKEIYRFLMKDTTKFLEAWNEYAKNWDDLKEVDLMINAGFRIQKSWYGNGFVANLHDLAYPRQYVKLDPDGSEDSGDETLVVMPTREDIFDGPQIIVSLGSPKTKVDEVAYGNPWPMFAIYGQDNVGFYVTGDDVTLNDVHFKNCDFGNNLQNLEYTGTVLEVNGDNVTVENSIIESGRNVIKAYDAKNFTLDNSLIQRAMEFLVRIGSYDTALLDPNKEVSWSVNRTTYQDTASNFLKNGGQSTFVDLINKTGTSADVLLSYGVMTGTMTDTFLFQMPKDNPLDPYSKEDYVNAAKAAAEAMTNDAPFKSEDGSYNYATSATIKDSYFYQSGISSISTDVSAQGSYLHSNITSIFSLLLMQYLSGVDTTNLATTMRPSSLKLEGDNKFYDWKEIDFLNFSSLVFQDIFGLIRDHGGVGTNFTITDDDYLPLRKMIKEEYSNLLYSANDKQYINIPIFETGGGANLSSVQMDTSLASHFQKETLSLDPYEWSMQFSQERLEPGDFATNAEAKIETMKIAMLRAASQVLGFHPYKMNLLSSSSHPWFNETPSLDDLRNRANKNN